MSGSTYAWECAQGAASAARRGHCFGKVLGAKPLPRGLPESHAASGRVAALLMQRQRGDLYSYHSYCGRRPRREEFKYARMRHQYLSVSPAERLAGFGGIVFGYMGLRSSHLPSPLLLSPGHSFPALPRNPLVELVVAPDTLQ